MFDIKRTWTPSWRRSASAHAVAHGEHAGGHGHGNGHGHGHGHHGHGHHDTIEELNEKMRKLPVQRMDNVFERLIDLEMTPEQPPFRAPDWREYRVEDVKELQDYQRRLHAKGLNDPWLRNEVWRFQTYRAKIPIVERGIRALLIGAKWGIPLGLLTVAADAYFQFEHRPVPRYPFLASANPKFLSHVHFEGEHGHGHGEHHDGAEHGHGHGDKH